MTIWGGIVIGNVGFFIFGGTVVKVTVVVFTTVVMGGIVVDFAVGAGGPTVDTG